MNASNGQVLWTPTAESMAATRMASVAHYVSTHRGLDFAVPVEYDRLWQWSVNHVEQFWADFASWAGVLGDVDDDEVLIRREMPGAVWFPDRTLNYAQRALAHDGTALVVATEAEEPYEVTWAELRLQVGAFAATLRDLGVGAGDRVAAYVPNIPEAVVAFLATASIGAVWCACAPDFGTRAVLERFAQVEPIVLVAVDGYRFNGRDHDRAVEVAEIRAALPSLRAVVSVPRLHPDQCPEGAVTWPQAISVPQEPIYATLPFDHPLWIVYSSGTTGLPKGIVHGHGGVVLEHLKQTGLHMDAGPGSRLFWYTSTAWMMWNVVVSSLLSGATAVLYDGSPTYPGTDAQFALAARTGVTHLGSSAGYLSACEKAGLRPGERYDLAALRFVGSTGSPLPASTYRWVYDAVGPDLFLASFSGGTDVVTSFIGGTPLLPVVAGELQRPLLGVAAAAWNDSGAPVREEVGELVITEPMPSMPLRFWGDPTGARYRETYFDVWPGVWRHGDWLEVTSDGACVISGRSDATLNRGGVRMGTADIYAAVESFAEVADALVLGVEQSDNGYWMPLFVQMAEGRELDSSLAEAIRRAIRSSASPRHVPDEIIAVPGLPHTRTGKRLEVPLKRVFQGADPAAAINLGTVDDPSLVDHFVRLARERAGAVQP